MLLVKAPLPVASLVLKLVINGFCVVAQHTPRAVTADPPSVAMLPPLVAVVEVMAEGPIVISSGPEVNVVKVP